LDPVWTALAFGLVIPVIAIVGGLTIAGLAIHHKARLKELAYRERIAMIEKGLVPSPETDPEKFDRAWESIAGRWADPAVLAERHRAANIITIGVGLAVMVLLYFVTGGSPCLRCRRRDPPPRPRLHRQLVSGGAIEAAGGVASDSRRRREYAPEISAPSSRIAANI
jgi:hypothetical protein